MRHRLRENALCASIAGVASATIAWLALYGFAWNDYDTEVRPAYEALVHGNVSRFLALAPAYGGSLIERAPFALAPGLWGGGPLDVYRAVALPCLLAAAVLGVWLVARMRALGRPTVARAIVLGVCVANPVTVRALEFGHPEELLGASLCVAAVLLAGSDAGRDRSLLAGALLGLAIANKEWALLAVGPVVLAAAPQRRARCLACAGVCAAALLAPFAIAGAGGVVAGTEAAHAASSSPIFQPWQLWWFLGPHGAPVHGLFGAVKPGYRLGPAWTGTIAHPLILLAGLVLAVALWARSRTRALDVRDALLALALVLLARCVLDTWDAIYYTLPFIFALAAWESTRPGRQLPLLAPACTGLVWLSFQGLAIGASPDAQAAFFLAWSLPLAAWLAIRLFARPTRAPAPVPAATGATGQAQEMTVSSLGRLVRTS